MYHRDGTDEGTEDTGLGSGSQTEENNNVKMKSSKKHMQSSTKSKRLMSKLSKEALA